MNRTRPPAPDRPGWRLLEPGVAKRCRYGAGPGRPACGRPAVAELARRRRRYVEPMDLDGSQVWWAYCEAHLYGRWIEDGAVMAWNLRAVLA